MKNPTASGLKVRMGTIVAALITSLCLGCGGGGGGGGDSAPAASGTGSGTTIGTTGGTTSATTGITTGATGGGQIVGCSTTGATSTITLANTPSRVNGVAPLSVFFDASATTAASTSRPFHDLEYRWNFGDSGSGNWSYGTGANTSKNATKGPVAAHVFDKPGIYTIALTISDGTNTVSNSCMQIAVQDANAQFSGANTICVAATTTPVAGSGGCPSGATVVQQSSFPAIIRSYATAGKRVLLKGGDVFTGTANNQLSAAGPGIIGSYGTGKAIIRTTGTSDYSRILRVTDSADWRLMDLEFDGQSDIHREAMSISGTSNKILMLRLYIHDIGDAIAAGAETATGAPYDQIALVDSSISHLVGGDPNSNSHGLYWGTSRSAIMGNLFSDTATTGNMQHLIRLQFADRLVMSHNQIELVRASKEMLAIRAPCPSACGGDYFPSAGLTGAAATTRKVVVSDNYIKQNTYAGIVIGPSNTGVPAKITDIILERNWVQTVAGYTAGHCEEYQAANITVRNEICDSSNTGSGVSFYVLGASTGEVASTNVHFYNTTTYSSKSGSSWSVFLISSGVTGTELKNNLAYMPNMSAANLVADSGTGTVGAAGTSGNSSNTQLRTVRPWASTTPVNPVDFVPASSYAIGGGITSVPVWSDFLGVVKLGTSEIGAFVH